MWLREIETLRDLVWERRGTRACVWRGEALALPADATHFLFCARGVAQIERSDMRVAIHPHMYAAVPRGCVVRPEPGSTGLAISHPGYTGLFQLGGPLESEGRLRYIDGCTDTLVLAPPVHGDPCFNHLHIPKDTVQTEHHHPSVRIGMIVRGSGYCDASGERIELRAGHLFVLDPYERHRFCTEADSIDVAVYHPETDTGPTHEDHPMRNRTLIER